MKLATESFINSVGVEKGLLYLLLKRKIAGKVNLWLKSISIVCPSPQGISLLFIILFSSRKLQMPRGGASSGVTQKTHTESNVNKFPTLRTKQKLVHYET